MSTSAIRHQSTATPSDDEVLVRVDGVGKKFCRSLKKSLWYGVCDIASELNPLRSEESNRSANAPRFSEGQTGLVDESAEFDEICGKNEGLRPGEFWAVQDVSFELRRGECLGLIGHNGAGKTTLLKMLNGLIKPDRGTITMRGRVGALIALGAGFNPILTGRENIYINGSVLGLTKKDIDEKIDEIIDFAEIREFIDMPVQSYSSGMSVRLGFAIASNLNPDVLILDEVLAVGDMSFRNKCYNKVGQLLKHSAVILVSHNMDHIANICQNVLYLNKGTIKAHGNPGQVINAFSKQMNAGKGESKFETINPPITYIKCNGPVFECTPISNLEFEVEYISQEEIDDNSIRLAFYDVNDHFFAEYNSRYHGIGLRIKNGKGMIRIIINDIPFKSGVYKMSLLIQDRTNVNNIVWLSKKFEVWVKSNNNGYTACQINGTVFHD